MRMPPCATSRTEFTISRQKVQLPPHVDPGDFIVWGDAAKAESDSRPAAPTFGELADAYLQASKGFKAESTLTTSLMPCLP